MIIGLILVSLLGMAIGWYFRTRPAGKAVLTVFTMMLIILAVYRIFNPPTYRDKVHEAYSRHFLAAGIGVGEQLRTDFPDADILFLDYKRPASNPFEKSSRAFLKGLAEGLNRQGSVSQFRIPSPEKETPEGEIVDPMTADDYKALRAAADVDIVILATGIPRTFTLEDLKRSDGSLPEVLLMRESSPAWQAKVRSGEIYGILEAVGTEQMNVSATPGRPLQELYRERFRLLTR